VHRRHRRRGQPPRSARPAGGDGESNERPESALGDWRPPGTDCGRCGARTCLTFIFLVEAGERTPRDCPYYRDPARDRYTTLGCG